MHDKRYLLSRRQGHRFVRTDDLFRLRRIDETERHIERLERRLRKPFPNRRYVGLVILAYLAWVAFLAFTACVIFLVSI